MFKLITIFLLFLSTSAFCQIKGTISDDKGKPIAFANIYVKDTYVSTSSNDKGNYVLNIKKTGTYTILFQYLGYKTSVQVVNFVENQQLLNVTLIEEDLQINEVVISKKDNLATALIRNAIANRVENSKKASKYTADFYSRGIFKVKDLPKKFMGQKIDDFDESIDSTRSGILYLSETISKITFQKPDKLKEIIIASKVSGNDSGFSFNNAASANFDFYENTIEFNTNAISPIASNAFGYYKFKLEGSFFDENKQQINKIKVTPRRISEPVFEGYIYIVEDSWAIYAVDLSITGAQIQNPALNKLTLKQNFSYNNATKTWIKNTQALDFNAGIFAFKFNGTFNYAYSNFEFPEQFAKKTFGNQILSFQDNANKKDDDFWNKVRPIPLTDEESADYLKKDALQTKKKSVKYLDSIDKKRNKFEFSSLLFGYSHQNSIKKRTISYKGPLLATSFNTVQGWNTSVAFSYNTYNSDDHTFKDINLKLQYGFGDKAFRPTVGFRQKFNNIDKSTLALSGGNKVSQFNQNNPISNIVNEISTLFFKDNYMKLYEKNFAEIGYSREVTNGLFMSGVFEYAERKPLYNTTNYSVVNNDKPYLSNNPLDENDYLNAGFVRSNMAKLNLFAKVSFGQKYFSRPNGKYNVPNDAYPTVNMFYEKGFAASSSNLNYDLLSLSLTQTKTLSNKGELNYNIKAGTFFNADAISFVDYKHFNGNQTHIGQSSSYTNVFNLLPYYAASTNKSYFEAHVEHNDKGFIMNKIPLLNKLKSQLVLGFHNLAVTNRQPYQEYSVGWDNLGFGKFRLFRFDYVRSYQNGYRGDGFVFGLKFLNALE